VGPTPGSGPLAGVPHAATPIATSIVRNAMSHLRVIPHRGASARAPLSAGNRKTRQRVAIVNACVVV
jgi:hypothetical protein